MPRFPARKVRATPARSVPSVHAPSNAVRKVWKQPAKLVPLDTSSFDRILKAPAKFALFAVVDGAVGFVQPLSASSAMAWTGEAWTSGAQGVRVQVRRRLGKVLDASGRPLSVGSDGRSLMLFKL